MESLSEKCDICWGYGLWAVGDQVPMGPIDYMDGLPNKKCPKCGSGGVPDTRPKNTPKDPPRGTAKAPPAPSINE